jgi:16S rRNA (cytosine967-C5)-methyltransferase
MTPGARLSAAIGVLDRVMAGAAAEQALTNWARGSRFAGSGDRAAVRDLVFDALRCRRSFATLGGSETGRGLILGGLRAAGTDPAALFSGEGHAPPPLQPEELFRPAPPEGLAALDCPDWLAPALQASLGADFEPVMQALRRRAPVFVRVNLARTDRDAAMEALTEEGIATQPHPLASSALEVTENARKIQMSRAYADGLVELQDAASQAVVEALPLRDRARVLDYCAGGGGKTLAMAARARLRLMAHDAAPGRMRDLPVRAARAGISVRLLLPSEVDRAGPFDLVLADVPCSGSGSWRRAPEGKWALTLARLEELAALQNEILRRTAKLVAPDGVLAYATCSMLKAENGAQIGSFLAEEAEWQLLRQHRFTPLQGGDGFYLALLTRR